MTVTELDESTILADAFPSRDATAAYICGYVRMALQSGLLHTTGPAVRAISPTGSPARR